MILMAKQYSIINVTICFYLIILPPTFQCFLPCATGIRAERIAASYQQEIVLGKGGETADAGETQGLGGVAVDRDQRIGPEIAE